MYCEVPNNIKNNLKNSAPPSGVNHLARKEAPCLCRSDPLGPVQLPDVLFHSSFPHVQLAEG